MILSILFREQIQSMELDASLTLCDLRALLEAEFGLPRLQVMAHGRQLAGEGKTLLELGLQNHDVITVKQHSSKQKISLNQWPTNVTPSTSRVSESNILDPEIQSRIEQSIAQTNINQNLSAALEIHPESFAPVSMLYIPLRVNDTKVTAFVDCGAQATIMSLKCAENCGFYACIIIVIIRIMRLVDRRWTGIAKGIGTGKIIGRVHSATISMGKALHLPSSFTVIEMPEDAPEMLFGLDLLRKYRAKIDLQVDGLIIDDELIPFVKAPEQQ